MTAAHQRRPFCQQQLTSLLTHSLTVNLKLNPLQLKQVLYLTEQVNVFVDTFLQYLKVHSASAEQQKKEGMRKYVTRMACEERIRIGMQRLGQHKAEIERVASAHDVPWQLLMAIWGIETNYGSFMGEHDVVTVLAHQAFELQGTPLGDYIRRCCTCFAHFLSPRKTSTYTYVQLF